MANNLSGDDKSSELLPDIESSTSGATEEASDKRKTEKEAQKEQEEESPGELSPEQQPRVSTQMTQQKQEQKISSQEENVAKLAATAATNVPGVGWFIKAVAIIIRILKFFTGEKIASFLAVWFLISAAFAFLNILPILGTIIFIIIPPCAALVITPIIWPKIKPFIEQAGKITPTKK